MEFQTKYGIKLPKHIIIHFTNRKSCSIANDSFIQVSPEIIDGVTIPKYQILAHEAAHARLLSKGIGADKGYKHETIARMWELHTALKRKSKAGVKTAMHCIRFHAKQTDWDDYYPAAKTIMRSNIWKRAKRFVLES